MLNFVDSYFSWNYRASGLEQDQILTIYKTKSIIKYAVSGIPLRC